MESNAQSMVVNRPFFTQQDNKYVVSFEVSFGNKTYHVWYSSTFQLPALTNSDFVVAACLFPAMKLGANLIIKGTVSEKLFRSLEQIQDIASSWFPGYRKIRVQCDGVDQGNESRANMNVGSFFSGGIDSFYTLLKHEKEITHLILIHGFDFSLERVALREKISMESSRVAQFYKKQLIEIGTNVRSFSNNYVDYGIEFHGAALASVALVLSPLFPTIFVPSSFPYATLYPFGSHPLLDPLWSNNITSIIHDGCEATRTLKAECISQSEIAFETLRVCSANTNDLYNCGECEKCVRTMAILRAVGKLDSYVTFAKPFELSKLSKTKIRNERNKSFYTDMLEYVKRKGMDKALEHAIQEAIDRLYYIGLRGWAHRTVNHFKRKVLKIEK